MNKRTKFLVAALLAAVTLSAGLFTAFHRGGESLDNITDLETLRVKLKEKVAHGELTEVQAQLRLAEALAAANATQPARRGREQRRELTRAQSALAAELRTQVERGDLTEQEARAKFAEVMKQAEAAEPGKRTR